MPKIKPAITNTKILPSIGKPGPDGGGCNGGGGGLPPPICASTKTEVNSTQKVKRFLILFIIWVQISCKNRNFFFVTKF
jgi:hypothetical protein